MIRSMTGFAAVSREESGERVQVSMKSVNHRFLDAQVRVPQLLAPIEARVKALLAPRLTRGRIEVAIGIESTAEPEREVALNDALLGQVADVIEKARARGAVSGGLSASDVLRIPGVLEIRPRAAEVGAPVPERLQALVERAVGDAVEALVGMRETEGRFLAADLETRLGAIGAFVDDLERAARAGQEALETRLRERVAALPADVAGDPAMVAQEIVRFVARSDVDEELVRMRTHIGHWQALVAAPEPCGRKLDFLLQEMNREINTIGSKVEGPTATELVIGAKAELERLREQVQNVE